ncbi:MAG: electron transport complex subunit RsxC [Lachnospiraceae bacterium]|nr:electron transport complex subunit RsxC [Lachnospiraceae bacterium]
MKVTFRGGVHPDDKKGLSRDAQLRIFDPEGDLIFPLSQHIGKPARAIVKKNDPVLVGQCIAEPDGFVSAGIYCSCSGTVKAVEKRRTLSGAMADCIVVENDHEYRPVEGLGKRLETNGLTSEEILSRIKNAGIVGLGGAGFPTHVKLAPKDPSAIRFVIANGAECEPYLTCNDQLMRQNADGIVEGLEITLRLFPNAKGVICIEKNKPEAIEAMQKAIAGKDRLEVLPLKTKYPQGGEHSLIKVVAGVDYPIANLPADVGCVVCNVGTLYAVGRAVQWNEPLFTHVLTVSGEAVKNPGNFIVRDGTSFSELLNACGGLKDNVVLKKALTGGPMMGFALSTLDVPVQKTSNGLTLFTEDGSEKAEKEMTACLRCGRCTTVCPTGLMPQMMASAVEFGEYDRYENKLHGLECVACGSCSYICPAKRPLTETFKAAKAEIMARKRAAQAGGKK